MPKYSVLLTRTYEITDAITLEVQAADEDEAWELAAAEADKVESSDRRWYWLSDEREDADVAIDRFDEKADEEASA